MNTVSNRTLEREVSVALQEDLGSGDVSAGLLSANLVWQAQVTVNETAVLCGQAWFNAAFYALDETISIHWNFTDGQVLTAGDTVCTLRGNARALLSAERTALNFLQTLSGTATRTRQAVRFLEGSATRLLDTRKTIPGLRQAQKYAVRCGGGYNHRIGLYDTVMLKENHIEALGDLSHAIKAARKACPDMPLVVEVESLQQLQIVLRTGVRHVLLDNFDLSGMAQAVSMVHEYTPKGERRCKLEASGNMGFDTIKAVAQTGVDFISMGSLTKHVRAIDFSMRFVAEHV